MQKLVLHTWLRAVGSSTKIKYLQIFSANTPNLQWLEPGLASAQELCTQSLPPSWLGWSPSPRWGGRKKLCIIYWASNW